MWLVNFDPSRGVEMQETRPAVIVSNNASSAAEEETRFAELREVVFPSPLRARGAITGEIG